MHLRGPDDGQWVLFAFRHLDERGAFVGGVTDPMPAAWVGHRLTVWDDARLEGAPGLR